MLQFQDKLNSFYERHSKYKKPLEKIINNMINKCKYINNESFERHNWGGRTEKLNLTNCNKKNIFNKLEESNNDNSIIELLWGDIQLGKRVHACIIMWITLYILERPILYVFRNLKIDKEQLYIDIIGSDKHNFNIQFILNIFNEYKNEYIDDDTYDERWVDFKLPQLSDINDPHNLSIMCEPGHRKNIYCCLMNHTQLKKIEDKFIEYIKHNDKLVNINILVDESDLVSPTSSNDMENNNDIKDSTLCEQYIAKIYKMARYALHITGTAHSLLYNITTRLSDLDTIQIKISKIHKMKRTDDYYGLFNKRIYFNTDSIQKWWKSHNESNNKNNNEINKQQYNIFDDYEHNIKNVIKKILNRQDVKYNSLLISEEKIIEKQHILINRILSDFPNIFIVLYNGKCLELYLSQTYEELIKLISKADSEDTNNKRLYQDGGIYCDKNINHGLPNNYICFEMDTKKFNIKMVYRLLRRLFIQNDKEIKYKTVITITGKYGERGYSFTSDDYNKYSFHLTDQYFVSHASLNCTDISQRLRLQGKYNDLELKNGSMKLTLWTTKELDNIINDFYINFINRIEDNIMNCTNWEEIINTIEGIIDNGEIKLKEYIKQIDVRKKTKNIVKEKRYEKDFDGYRLLNIKNMNDEEIKEWCVSNNFPDYICINSIIEDNIKNFNEKYCNDYGKYKPIIPKRINKNNDSNKIIINESNKPTLNLEDTLKFIKESTNYNNWNSYGSYNFKTNKKTKEYYDKLDYINAVDNNKEYFHKASDKSNKCYIINYDNDDYYYLTGFTDIKHIPTIKCSHNNIMESIPNIVINDIVKYSIKNNDNNYETFYWKTYDDWLYLYDKNKKNIFSVTIKIPNINDNIQTITPQLNQTIKNYFDNNLIKPNDTKIRIGITEIYNNYKKWCDKEKIKYLKHIEFKEQLKILGHTEEKSKGRDIHGKSKRGYNLKIK